MKKILTLVLVIGSIIATAQTPVLTPVTYRGAFAPAPAAMWTAGWTNWDPQSITTYDGGTDSTIETAITSNITLSASKKYRLKGTIFVKNGATLTIQAGCTIKGDSLTANSALVITRGAKINAKGTSTRPIIFTSGDRAGQRDKGDWGGVIILGNAHFNGANGFSYIEGIAQSEDTKYGGGATPNDDDSSGVMQYCRIEYGGYIFAANQEINGLTFGAVGRKTVIDHIQVSFANDDAYEWFGGTVNCKYLVAYRCLDDNFDTDNGYSGAVQFALGVRDPNISDNPAVSTSEGFESDNDAGGTSNRPYTTAIFANITEIGPLRGNTAATIATGFRRNVRIRRNSHLRIVNSVLMDYPTGVFIDGAASVAAAQSATLGSGFNNPANLVFKNNLLAGQQTGKVCERNVNTFDIWNWFGTNKNDSIASTTGILTTPYDFLVPDYRPAVNSPALRNTNWNDSAFYYVDSTGALTSLIACPATPATPGTIIGTANACTKISSGDTAKYYISTKSILGILRPEWTVPSGVTLISGQFTDTIVVTFSNAFTGGSITAKNRSYCGVLSAARSLAINKGVPKTPGTISGPVFVCDYIQGDSVATYSIVSVLYATGYNWVAPANATIEAGQGTTTVKVRYSASFTTGSLQVQATAVCGNSTFKTLAISKVAAAPAAIIGKTATCGFTGTPLTYTIRKVANASSYIWTVPVGATINETGLTTVTVPDTSIQVTYNTALKGAVTVKSITACGESIAKSLSVAIVATPLKINGAITVCPLDESTYTVLDTANKAGSTVYTWTVPATVGTIISGQGTPSVTIAFAETFLTGSISVKAVGCGISSSARSLTINQASGCAPLLKSQAASVDAKAINLNNLSVYPNPARGEFTVSFTAKNLVENASVQLLNNNGQAVFTKVVSSNGNGIKTRISTANLPAGIYVVKVLAGTEIKTTKLVIE